MKSMVLLKRMATIRVSNVDKKSADGELPVRLCNYTDVYYRAEIGPEQDFMAATASPGQVAAFRLQAGDVVITKDSETADDIGVPAYVRAGAPDLVCGYHLAIVRPDSLQLNGRYLFWFMSSDVAKEQLSVAATGVTRFGLRADSAGNLGVPSFSLARQRSIADYLDRETARIDVLIDKKRRLDTLILQRQAAQVEQEIRRLVAEWGEVSLRYLVERISVGIVITPAAWYVNDDSGVIALRGTNVVPGRLRLDDVVRISQEGHAFYAKSALRAGDVVVVRTGQAGAAVVVPPELEGANCIDLILVRPGTLEPHFLQFVLNSDWAQKHIAEHSVGTIQSHFNISAMKSLPVPRAPRHVQFEVVARLGRLTSHADKLHVRLNRQIAQLEEHRRALITAAVTGELEIPGAA